MRRIWFVFPILTLLLAACGGSPAAQAPVEQPTTVVPTEVVEEPEPTVEVVATPEVTPTPASYSTEELAERLRPATVRVVAKFGETAIDYEGLGAGTGVVFDLEQGLILTNAHVVEGAASVQIALADSPRTRAARVVGRSQCDDLAVLQVSDTSDLQVAPLGESRAMKAGAEVVALGYPLSFDLGTDISVNRGSISQLNASLGKFEDLLKIDVAINHGNSGGPLVNTRGEVIGINTLGLTGAQNQNYAIAMSHALPIVRQLQEGKNRSYIGLNLVPNDYADFFGTSDGMAIVAVASGSPAARAGVEAADLLLKMEGASIGSEEDVCGILRSHGDGDQIRIQVLRAATGEVLEGELTLGQTGAATSTTPRLEVVATLDSAEPPAAGQDAPEQTPATDAANTAPEAPAGDQEENPDLVTTDFTTDDGNWPLADDENFSAQLAEQHYQVVLKTPQQYLTVTPDRPADLPDGGIAAELRIDEATGYAGVMLRYSKQGDTRNMYACWISNEGTYGCFKSINDEWTVLIEPTAEPAIKRNDANQVLMSALGNELLFNINGKVINFSDDSLANGAAGLYVENFDEPLHVSYDSVAIFSLGG
jgi:serine protease Do